MSHQLAPTFRIGHEVANKIFDPGSPTAQANANKEYREGSIRVNPVANSSDYMFLVFKSGLADHLSKEFPAMVSDDGLVFGNGVRSNFQGIRHVSGYPMQPATFPLAENEYLREKSGLSNTFTDPRHEVFLRAFVRHFFGNLEPQKIPLKKNSSSMAPYYTKDMNKKEGIVKHSLLHGQKAGEMMLKGDYTTPWLKFQIGGAYHTVYRQQATDAVNLVDGVFVPKDRPVADLEFAISGGRSGTFLPASKQLGDVDFKHPPDFFRARNRTAKGGPLGMNSVLMPIAHSVRKRIYSAYAYTYHHTTRASIEADVRELKYTIAADVSNHDIYWPHLVLHTICDELLKMGFAPWWVELYRVKSKLPDYVTDVAPGVGNILIGDWRNPNNSGGLPSGNAFTDLEGTIGMSWIYFLIQVEHTYPALLKSGESPEAAFEIVGQYLTGALPIKLKDKSDDAILGWSDSVFIPAAKALQAKMVAGEQISPYMHVSYEHGGAFLGSILYYPESLEMSQVTLMGNILSLVNNQFAPEYGIYSGVGDRRKSKRPFGGLAWNTIRENYGTSPIYDEVMDIIEFHWERQYHESYSAMRRAWAASDEAAMAQMVHEDTKMQMSGLTAVDVEVLMDPSRAEWKYAESDISKGVLDTLFNGVGLEHTEPFFNSVVNGVSTT